MGRRTRWAAACAVAGLLAVAAPPTGAAFAASAPRIDLRLLVVDDGGPAVAAIVNELDLAGTPYTRVDLGSSGRPVLNAGFLAGTSSSGQAEAKYQAVVLPNNAPAGLGADELAALAAYEQTYGVRQVDAYTYAQPAVGLNWAADPGYIGPLDGTSGTVTAAGLAGPFTYLRGSVPFEDNDPSVTESYGYLATPLATQAAGASFTPLVTAPIPGSGAEGVLAGQYDHDGRSELVLTFAYNQYQQQFRLLARGIVDWATQGIHLGYDRNYFEVHVDDVFLPDDRWSSTAKCTPGDAASACQGTPAPSEIRMTPADVSYAQQWSQQRNFTLDLLFNGGGSDDAVAAGGSDPLTTALLAAKNSFRWVNHTYDHPFLGCVQNTATVPWSCTKDASGNTQWVSESVIQTAIQKNQQWAAAHGLPVDNTELVTGEHSGLRTLPRQPVDNPNLATALAASGIRWTGSDHSREPDQRSAGSSTLTVPRYPMNVYYNAGTTADEVDEYNWLYTGTAQGGSGICTANPATTTCMSAPLDESTGYADYIVPLEVRIDLGHVLANSPLPHYIHQSNLAEDRIAYPVLDGILTRYGTLLAANAPLLNLRESAIGTELKQRAAWQSALAAGKVTAYRVGGTVTVQAPSGTQAQVTMPNGTTQQQLLGTSAVGTAYAGELSGWVSPGLLQTAVTLKLSSAAVPAAGTTPSSGSSTSGTATAGASSAPATNQPYVPGSLLEPVQLTLSGAAKLLGLK